LIKELKQDQIGGLLALPAAETVKRAQKDEAGAQRVAGTEDRSQLWLAQTPQMFRAGLLLQALSRAKGAPTDEAITRWMLQAHPIGNTARWEVLRNGLRGAGLPVEGIVPLSVSA